jgi:probable H4MPT-linked C1 transfer pathway protein
MIAESNHQTNTDKAIIGWDIGGVNLKAARLSAGGLTVVQEPFAIWQHRDELVAALTGISARLGPARYGAVTITAELSDAFRTKREGIGFVLDALRMALPETALWVFGVDGRFHDVETAYQNPMLVAAANWLATAMLVARDISDGLLVDIGSTSTDIIPIAKGRVIAQGRNDPERLLCGELLYTGALRTPICAIVQRIPLRGGRCPVAAELFATAQDVHLLLNNLSIEQCTSPSADGRPVTPEFAAERLARVVCADIEMLGRAEIRTIARYIAAEQVHQVAQAIGQVISGSKIRGPVVAVGVGAFLAQAAAARLGLDYRQPSNLGDSQASHAAPAVAVARLFDEMEPCLTL